MRFVDVKTKLTNYSVVPNDLYGIGISSTALVLYAKLLNRTNLSISNNRVDEFGRVYVLYKLEDLAQELGRSVSAIKSNMNELVSAGLIEKRRADKGRANVFNVIDRRYRSGKPLIITTNLHLSMLTNEQSLDKKRIYDRILELCIPVCVNGASKRTATAKEKMKEMQEIAKSYQKGGDAIE